MPASSLILSSLNCSRNDVLAGGLPARASDPSSRAWRERSGLLPIVDIEAAVLRRPSVDRSGTAGGCESFDVDVALPSHAKGAVTLRGCGAVGEGPRSEGRFGGAPQGTEGRAADKPWNRETFGSGFEGSALLVAPA